MSRRLQLIEPEVFECLLLVCRPAKAIGMMADQTAARNRAILWILMDTGMRASELCGLRLCDVKREQRTLRVEGRSQERWLPLSPNAWYQLLSYLECRRPKKEGSERQEFGEEPLFLSETYESLSINALTLLFDRLRKRAGMSGQPISPSQLRETFAVRSLRAGGEQEALRNLLDLRGKTALKRYEPLNPEGIEHGSQEAAETHASGQQPVPQTNTQHQRRSSPTGSKTHQQKRAERLPRTNKKKSDMDAEEDP